MAPLNGPDRNSIVSPLHLIGNDHDPQTPFGQTLNFVQHQPTIDSLNPTNYVYQIFRGSSLRPTDFWPYP